MTLDSHGLLNELDLRSALEDELQYRSHLMPDRPDLDKLRGQSDAVAGLLKVDQASAPADVVLADKVGHGTRPLNVMTLPDRVHYRALVNRIRDRLPERAWKRPAYSTFERGPLESDNQESPAYVTALDVSSYYVYVDHAILADELISQTGDVQSVMALMALLERVMGRRVGLPQVSDASDVLGDVHLDVVRRRLIRRGIRISRYADDFRVVTTTLGEARRAIEQCSLELNTLGLVLSDHKTRTWKLKKYGDHIDRFVVAEKRLFSSHNGADVDVFSTLMKVSIYPTGADNTENEGEATPRPEKADSKSNEEPGGLMPVPADGREVAEALEEATQSDLEIKPTSEVKAAAIRAWNLWTQTPRNSENASDFAVRRKLAGRALRVLGPANVRIDTKDVRRLLTTEPGLTPDLMAYFVAISDWRVRTSAMTSLADLLKGDPPLSTWQKIWVAHTIGQVARHSRPKVRRPKARTALMEWLVNCLGAPDGLAATAAASLGSVAASGHKQDGRELCCPTEIAQVVERVAPEWKTLAILGLAGIDRDLAIDISDDLICRIVAGGDGDD